ncbi:hypothetical protein HN789_06190 [archaeon]|nr:hypothetical protein [archaeon]MBT4022359.1 hypothetical protein [archaeon]MBT4273237.1 hypothetical protein [archaeon]MBT4461320.1 hypothetical protein [archaeon]MBT4858677.1 hypothetical protein [archaeon]
MADVDYILKLEELVQGKTDKIDFLRNDDIQRDNILECLHRLLMSGYPETTPQGCFLESENYIIYELSLNHNKTPSSFRVLDFGDKFTVLRL